MAKTTNPRPGLKPPLTPEETRAVAALRRIAKRWPDDLWLYSAGGTLHVMKYAWSEDGQGMKGAGADAAVDQDGIVAVIRIPNGGGDW